MKEVELVDELISGTVLVEAACAGTFDMADFVARYDNFFYYNGLGGEEADGSAQVLFSKYDDVRQLHKAVQTDVVDPLYLGENQEAYLAAGRILPDEAVRRLRRIASEHQVARLLDGLRRVRDQLA